MKSFKEGSMNITLIIRCILFTTLLSTMVVFMAYAQKKLQTDILQTSGGDLKMTFIAHGTLMFTFGEKVIHIDPVSMFGTDYAALPKADLILVTHNTDEFSRIVGLQIEDWEAE